MSRRQPFGNALLGSPTESPGRLRVRVQLLLTALLVSTQLVGATAAFSISTFAVPTSPLTADHRSALTIAVPCYVASAVGVGLLWSTRSALRATAWVRRDREPSGRERRRVMRLPLHLTMIQAILWGAALVVFDTLALVFQPDRLLGLSFAIAITGAVVAGVTYLLSEFTLRPVAARALRGSRLRRRTVGVGGRMLLFWTLGTAAPVAGLVVTAIVALVSPDMTRQRLAVIVLSLAGVVLLFGLLVTWLNSRSVVAPIETVRAALVRVRDGRLDTTVTVFDGTQLGQLQAGFNEMAAGLREREAIRDLFGRHVGEQVAQAATAGTVVLGGETRAVTVLFVDIIGSTSLAQHVDPQEVVRSLNAFFEVVVDEVDGHGGLVNKFLGDAALAVFGAPVDLDDHATAGLATARRIATRLVAEVPTLAAGIGVVTGEVVAGNIGGATRFEYTVIGDAVNTAARLCELAKDRPDRLLTTDRTVAAASADERRHWTVGEGVTLRGRDEPTTTMGPVDPAPRVRAPADTSWPDGAADRAGAVP